MALDWRKLAAELVGTFGFLWIGYMSVAAFEQSSAPGLLVVPFAFGLGLLAAIFCFGHISGGHYNPAVTIAMILDKRIAVPEAIGYIVAQSIGAIGAALLVMATLSQEMVAKGITQPQGLIESLPVSAVIIEAVGTMGFLLVILTVTKKAAAIAGLVIPFALVALHFAMATITGASVNPARSLGSALVGGDIAQLWIYIVGPVIGAVVAFVVWKVMNPGEAEA